VRNEAEGRKAVRKVKEWGADFVKVYTLLPRDAYFGIADEARQQGPLLSAMFLPQSRPPKHLTLDRKASSI